MQWNDRQAECLDDVKDVQKTTTSCERLQSETQRNTQLYKTAVVTLMSMFISPYMAAQ